MIRLPHQSGRYLAVGACCALLNNLILIGGDAAGLHYTAAVMLTFVIVLPASYLAHALWTFDVELGWPAWWRFVLGSLSSLMVAGVTVAAFRGLLLLPMVVAAPLATVAMTAYNFLMTKWAIARRTM